MTKTKSTQWIVKLVFGLALLVFILWKIASSEAWNELGGLKFTPVSYLFLFIAIMLMPFNWILETIKWKTLMKSTQQLSWKVALLSVLAGISTGLMTPNRIGNFIGRTVYVDSSLKRKAIFVTLQSNLSQFLATLMFGLLGLSLLGQKMSAIHPIAADILAAFVFLTAFYAYVRPSIAMRLVPRKWIGAKNLEAVDHIDKLPMRIKLNALMISLLRYAVFLLQFFLLLLFFDDSLDVLLITSGISVVYLITTLIPSFLFGKLFVREASALFVLTEMGVQSSAVLIAVFILWLINLAVPALAGSIILIRTK